MGRLLQIGALALLFSLGAVLDAVAIPLDPIVRTRAGSIGSVPISSLPLTFDFYPDDTASFPDIPTNTVLTDSCINGTTDEFGGSLAFLTCEFENRMPVAITALDFTFLIPDGSGELIFLALDPNSFFASESIGPGGAQFTGGSGVPACGAFEGESCLAPYHFLVDFYGFPVGTKLTMTAAEAAAVPEPATLTLLGTGLALAVARRRRRR